MIPSADTESCTAQSVMNVTEITVDLEPDAYSHLSEPYSEYADETVRFYGDGLDAEHSYTVAELESMQKSAVTRDFSVLDKSGKSSESRYRGISVYELFTEIGIKNNAGDVIIYSGDGTSVTFSLSTLKKQNFTNFISPSQESLGAILAFGSGIAGDDILEGRPLVANKVADGYDASFGNFGGPLRLIVPQDEEKSANSELCVNDVVAVEVTANDIDTWGHAMSDVFSEFLDDKFTFTVKNDDSEWTAELTVAELESLKGIIVRDNYSVLELGECEGVDIWKFIQLIAGKVSGISDPVSVTVYAADGYKNDLLSVFYKDGLENGIEDENGDRKTLILAYAINGYPLVDSESHEGYTGLARNAYGPLRVVAETNQGASVKYASKLVVTVPGSGKIDITVDRSIFDVKQ